MCIYVSRPPVVTAYETIRIPSERPVAANGEEQSLLQRTLLAAHAWKARLEVECTALPVMAAIPQRTFVVQVMSTKPEGLVDSLWTEARVTSDVFKAKYKPFFESVAAGMKSYVNESLKKETEEVRTSYTEFVSASKAIREFGFPEALIEYFPDCVKFLKQSNLIYHIRAFQTMSSEGELTKGMELDRDGHPLIFMQGRWTRWETIKNRLVYDAIQDKIVSRNNPQEAWNYFPANPQDARFLGGLVPVDKYDDIFPVHTLTREERIRLSTLGHKFYETNPELDPGVAKTCFLQVFTTERGPIMPENPMCDNVNKEMYTHVGVRLVDSDGKVYSIGYEIDKENDRLLGKNFPQHYFTTTDGHLASRDYEEFRKFDQRRVTTIPLTAERFGNMLESVKEISKSNIRFNYVGQNCTAFGTEMVRQAGYEQKFTTDIYASIWRALPAVGTLPYVGFVLDKINTVANTIMQCFANWTPSFIQTAFSWAATIVFFIPDRISIILSNLLLMKLGGFEHTPRRAGLEESKTSRIRAFTSQLTHWTDLFKRQSSVFHSPGLFKAWQNRQHSTAMIDYEGPKMYILPRAIPA